MDFNLALTHVERVAWDLVLSNQQISAQFACTKSANRVTAAYCLPFSELKIDEKKPFDLIWHHPIERFVELPIIKCNCLSTKCRKLTVAGDEVKRIEHRFQFELIPGIHSFATATLCRFELCTMWCHHGYYVCERQPCRNRIVFVFDDFPLRQTNPVSVLRHSQNKKNELKSIDHCVDMGECLSVFATRAQCSPAQRCLHNANWARYLAPVTRIICFLS